MDAFLGTFKLQNSEGFDEVMGRLDGRTVESTITMDGDIMNQVQVGDKTTYITRKIEENMLKTTVKVEELVSHRDYVRV
ncbi:unnamed protein product [Dibothriocephalus latus]|uniref:Cytosolic fatty-acid binding proteins domain-containing protein n=1 Tax=Dibothriocephalus latus TaxID=60516 RepID=A0A3P7P6E0_DIBLA|nr:unnamed protein product [Dibothriocephalus latus]